MIAIRPERPEDAPAIRSILVAAFGGEDEARLVERLRADGDAALSLVAVEEGRVVGHVLFSRLAAPFPALALAPLAVDPARQRSGIGAALVRAGVATAGREAWAGVFVLGEPAYYGRFGFRADLAAGFASPYAGPHLMGLALRGSLPARQGALVHAPAFAAL